MYIFIILLPRKLFRGGGGEDYCHNLDNVCPLFDNVTDVIRAILNLSGFHGRGSQEMFIKSTICARFTFTVNYPDL